MRKAAALILIITLTMQLVVGCEIGKYDESKEYTKYHDSFFDTFDTITQVVGYTKSQEEFDEYLEKIHQDFSVLHKLYDKYKDYEGINNIKTINDNAGKQPVKVDKKIIELIEFGKYWNKQTEGQTNIAMGAITEIWHEYREEGKFDPANAKLPPLDKLQEAAKHTDIDKVIVDKANSTVYLEDPKMSLDVGAVAKGYATEVIAQEIMAAGLQSGMISAGGNIRVLGKPMDGVRKRWGIGIQDPEKSIVSDDQSNLLDVIFLNNSSVVSSGDYQRYYVVDNKIIHHLINPKTLMPGDYNKAVTIVTEHSGVADALSTAVFLMPYQEGRRLVESLEGVEAVWVLQDGKIEATKGMQKIMKSHGATGAKDE